MQKSERKSKEKNMKIKEKNMQRWVRWYWPPRAGDSALSSGAQVTAQHYLEHYWAVMLQCLVQHFRLPPAFLSGCSSPMKRSSVCRCWWEGALPANRKARATAECYSLRWLTFSPMTIISRAGQGIGNRLYYEEGKLEGSEGKKATFQVG